MEFEILKLYLKRTDLLEISIGFLIGNWYNWAARARRQVVYRYIRIVESRVRLPASPQQPVMRVKHCYTGFQPQADPSDLSNRYIQNSRIPLKGH